VRASERRFSGHLASRSQGSPLRLAKSPRGARVSEAGISESGRSWPVSAASWPACGRPISTSKRISADYAGPVELSWSSGFRVQSPQRCADKRDGHRPSQCVAEMTNCSENEWTAIIPPGHKARGGGGVPTKRWAGTIARVLLREGLPIINLRKFISLRCSNEPNPQPAFQRRFPSRWIRNATLGLGGDPYESSGQRHWPSSVRQRHGHHHHPPHDGGQHRICRLHAVDV